MTSPRPFGAIEQLSWRRWAWRLEWGGHAVVSTAMTKWGATRALRRECAKEGFDHLCGMYDALDGHMRRRIGVLDGG